MKSFDIFLIFAQNFDCGYKLEPPRRGGSNGYAQSMFGGKNKKKGIPLHTPVLLLRGYSTHGHVFLMEECGNNFLYSLFFLCSFFFTYTVNIFLTYLFLVKRCL